MGKIATAKTGLPRDLQSLGPLLGLGFAPALIQEYDDFRRHPPGAIVMNGEPQKTQWTRVPKVHQPRRHNSPLVWLGLLLALPLIPLSLAYPMALGQYCDDVQDFWTRVFVPCSMQGLLASMVILFHRDRMGFQIYAIVTTIPTLVLVGMFLPAIPHMGECCVAAWKGCGFIAFPILVVPTYLAGSVSGFHALVLISRLTRGVLMSR